jgi:signal transduction histidine kinase
MIRPRRQLLVYGLLLTVWGLVLGWQVAEHFRVRESAREELINRAKDISTTVGIVLRSQRHFGNVVTRERLESALTELVRPGELNAIALLNAAGEVVASAGPTNFFQFKGPPGWAELWDERTVTLMNLVDLGANLTRDMEVTNPPIVLSRQSFQRPPETNQPAPPPDRPAPPPEFNPDNPGESNSVGAPNPPPSTNRSRFRGEGRPRFGRPPWMNEADYRTMIEKQGVHSFMIVMSTQPVIAACQHDLWLRAIIAALATVSVVGSGLVWRNLGQTSELQIRLVRASELNSHLKEMNLAAAGLAHETRNPLNIIRGLAQMLSKQPDAAPETIEKTRAMIAETDRVTAQLNEFINYSKPREVRRAALALGPLIEELVHTLGHDIAEKNVQLRVSDNSLTIEADERLLRQALFNLFLNAIQAVDAGGEIHITAGKLSATEAFLEIRDNGPGVAADQRAEIFKPYFTTTQKGTGLGLAVVQQIVMAHGWEIQCLANEPRGAIFRITHLKLPG